MLTLPTGTVIGWFLESSRSYCGLLGQAITSKISMSIAISVPLFLVKRRVGMLTPFLWLKKLGWGLVKPS